MKYFVKGIVTCIAIGMMVHQAGAQILRPVKWTFSSQKINASESYVLLTATIDKGWHIYALSAPGADGPIPTSFKFSPSAGYTATGKIQEMKKPVVEFDKTFRKNIGFYAGTVQFRQKIKVKSGSTPVKGSLEFEVCNNSQCLPPETVEFSVAVN